MNHFTKDWHKKLKVFSTSLLKNIPNIIISMAIMISITNIFGKNYSVFGILFLFFQILNNSIFNIKKYAKSSVILIIVTTLSTIAQLNTGLTILLGFLVPFLLVILFSDEVSTKGYYIYGLFFLLIQTTSANSSDTLQTRLIIVILCLTILFVYNLIISKIKRPNPQKGLIDSTITTIIDRLKKLSKKELTNKTLNPIYTNITTSNSLLYDDISQKTRTLTNTQENIFHLNIFAQRVNNLITEAYTNYDLVTKEDQSYYFKLSSLLLKIQKLYSAENKEKILAMLTSFIENFSLSDENKSFEWEYSLKKLKHIIKNSFKKQKAKVTLKEAMHIKLIHLKSNLSLDNSQTRFALRLSLAIGVSTIIASFIPFAKAYWLITTAYSLILPFHEDEKMKLKNNIVGAILGAIIFTAIFQFVPTSFSMLLMAIIFSLIFSLKNEITRSAISSQMALVFAYPLVGKIEALGMRIILVFASALIIWIFDMYVFKNSSYQSLLRKCKHLLAIDRIVLKELKRAIQGKGKLTYLNEFLLESYSIENLIIMHEQKQEKYDGNHIANTILQYNKTFLLDAEQLINIFYYNEATDLDKKEVMDLLDDMDKILHITQNKCISSNIIDPKKTKVDKEKLQELKLKYKNETSYTQKHIYFCVKNISKIYLAIDKVE